MAARRRTVIGDIELGVLNDLASIPEYLREGGLAKDAIHLARILDANGGDGEPLSAGGVAALSAQLRMILVTLLDAVPRKGAKDGVDQVKDQLAARRAARRAT